MTLMIVEDQLVINEPQWQAEFLLSQSETRPCEMPLISSIKSEVFQFNNW